MFFPRKQLQSNNGLARLQTLLRSNSGQALLIVVLIMVVALTVTLSLVSRSIVNLKTSVDQTNSQQALAAAEAGIEQSIKNNASVAQQTFSNNASFSTTYTQVAGNISFLANGGNLVSKNEGSYVWLSRYDPTGNWGNQKWTGDLTIYWGDTTVNDNFNAALEISVMSGDSPANAVIKRYALDPYGARGNNFILASSAGGPFTVGSKTFKYRYILNGANAISNGFLVRIIPIYYSTYIGIAGSTVLPDQGNLITADGVKADTKRRITVFEGYPQLPAEFFPYSLLSP